MWRWFFAGHLLGFILFSFTNNLYHDRVARTDGWIMYLDTKLVEQFKDQYDVCEGGFLGLKKNKTSCAVLTKLTTGKEVGQLAKAPKPPTQLLDSWLLSKVSSKARENIIDGFADCRIQAVRVPNVYRHTVCRASRIYHYDVDMLAAQLNQESGFNPNAVSSAKAKGIAQIIDSTARAWSKAWGYKVDVNDPHVSIYAMARAMSEYYTTFKRAGLSDEESYKRALACYNAGPTAVKRHKGVPPFRETRRYVANIWGRAGKFIRKVVT